MMEGLVWARVPGDIVFAFGTLFLALFVFRLLRRTQGSTGYRGVASRRNENGPVRTATGRNLLFARPVPPGTF